MVEKTRIFGYPLTPLNRSTTGSYRESSGPRGPGGVFLPLVSPENRTRYRKP